MSNYFIFTDEAGAYQRRPSDAHIRSHPFYIRSNVVMSIDDYRQYQIGIPPFCFHHTTAEEKYKFFICALAPNTGAFRAADHPGARSKEHVLLQVPEVRGNQSSRE